MNSESKINIHYSSLVDLKAELLRKQTEVQSVKSKQGNVLPTPKSKPKSKNKRQKNDKSENEKEKDLPEDVETMKTHKKSKLMLEAKSRLYEKLSKTRVNMNPNFLVNFEEKSEVLNELDDEKSSEDDYKSDYVSDDDGWVEYTDCFGRTKKCLKEDLPKMQEKDEKIRKEVVEKPHSEVKDQVLYVEDRIPAREPTIEVMRKKWEEQSAKLMDKVDIHYQDILFDEARTHGVGYFAFSQDEEVRAKQQESLLKIRTETEQKQKENKEINDMKLQIQQNRLKVARLRQRIRAGLPPEETEEESNASTTGKKLNDNESKTVNEKEVEEVVTNNISETTDSQEADREQVAKRKLADIENKIQAFGELLGKKNEWYVMTQDEWVHKKRKERKLEFGPVYKGESTSSSVDHDTIGPMPPSPDNHGPVPPLPEDEGAIGPMPPSPDNHNVIEPAPTSNLFSSSKTGKAIVGDQIEAGLKYLRQQFEKKN